MKVLVTGATGYVGAWAAKELLDAGHEVRLLVRTPAKVAKVAGAIGVRDVDVVRGDVTDGESVRAALEGCAAVVHAAGAVSLARADIESNMRTNVAAAHHVLGQAVDAGLRAVVHVSSIAALDPGAGPLTGDSPLSTGLGYARSKAAAEDVARRLQTDGAPVRIIYPGGVLGPAAGEAMGEASTSMAAFLGKGVFPTHQGALPVVDVRDLAVCMRALVEQDAPPGRVMAGGETLQLVRLAELMRQITGRRYLVPRLPGSAMKAVGRALDVLTERLPVELPLTEEAMATIVDYPGNIDNVDEVGVTLRPVEQTLATTVQAWADVGLFPQKVTGRYDEHVPA